MTKNARRVFSLPHGGRFSLFASSLPESGDSIVPTLFATAKKPQKEAAGSRGTLLLFAKIAFVYGLAEQLQIGLRAVLIKDNGELRRFLDSLDLLRRGFLTRLYFTRYDQNKASFLPALPLLLSLYSIINDRG